MSSLEDLQSSESRWYWLTIGLLLPAFILGCWSAPFLACDDQQIIRDVRVQAQTPLCQIWVPDPAQPYYNPIHTLSLRFDRMFWGTLFEAMAGPNAWPAGIRTTNLILHGLATLWLWLLLRQLRAPPRLCGFVAIAFALHPTVCETVCWPTERNNALAVCSGLCACWLYVKAAGRLGYYLLASLVFMLGMLSKPTTLEAAGILCVWELLGRPHLGETEQLPAPGPRQLALRLSLLLPWLALGALIGAMAVKSDAVNLFPPPGGTWFTTVLTDVPLLRHFIHSLLWPDLSVYYDLQPVRSLSEARLWMAGIELAVLLVAVLIVQGQTRWRLAIFPVLWFGVALLPALNFISVNTWGHDRHAYMASPAVWIIVYWLLSALWRRMTAQRPLVPQWLAPAALIILGLGLAVQSGLRGCLFRDANGLFEEAARKSPRSAYANLFHAVDLWNRYYQASEARDWTRAQQLRQQTVEYLERGIACPDFEERYLFVCRAHVELATLYWELGRDDEAAAQALAALAPQALRIRPSRQDLASACQILGAVALNKSQPATALKHFDNALRIHDTASIQVWRAKALRLQCQQYQQQGRQAEAQTALQQAFAALSKLKPADRGYVEAQTLLQSLPELRPIHESPAAAD